MDIKQYLNESFFLFKGIPNKDIDAFLAFDGIREAHFLSGDTILCSNKCESIGIVAKGKATIKSGENGVIIKKLQKGDIFGVAGLFNKSAHSTIIKATSDCTVITLDKGFVEKCISKNHTCALNYITLLAEKIAFLNKKINSYTAKSAENKLHSYLLQLPRDGNTLELNIDMSTLAKMIGIGRATLYRAFEKLEANGTITKNDKFIIFNEV